MAMIQYFKRVNGQYPRSKLLDPQGTLAQEVPSRAISAANTEVAFNTSASWWSEGEHERNVPENEF